MKSKGKITILYSLCKILPRNPLSTTALLDLDQGESQKFNITESRDILVFPCMVTLTCSKLHLSKARLVQSITGKPAKRQLAPRAAMRLVITAESCVAKLSAPSVRKERRYGVGGGTGVWLRSLVRATSNASYRVQLRWSKWRN